MEDLLSTQDAAELLGVTRQTIINYIQEDRLGAQRLGKAYKISEDEFVRFARDTGMPDDELTRFRDKVRSRPDKKTRSLARRQGDDLIQNKPPRAIIPDSETFYFLSVKPLQGNSEIIIKVQAPRFFIGRHSLASLSIQDPYISNIHANLIFDNGLITVQDQSTNGTWVGSKLLQSAVSDKVGDGDQCKVGTHILTFISPHRVDIYLNS